MREFDPKMEIPIQFHIRVKNYRHGQHVPELIKQFFDITEKLPNSAIIVWHGFGFGWHVLHGYLTRRDNNYVTFCARDSKRMAYLEVILF